MRHRISGKKLSRTRDQRKALFKSLISSLVIHGRIKTTEAKAKAVRRLADRLITKAKTDGLHGRRQVASILHNKKVVNRLVDEIAPRFLHRPGGFTRILRLGPRKGDQAMMVELSLVEGEEEKEKGVKTKSSKKEK